MCAAFGRLAWLPWIRPVQALGFAEPAPGLGWVARGRAPHRAAGPRRAARDSSCVIFAVYWQRRVDRVALHSDIRHFVLHRYKSQCGLSVDDMGVMVFQVREQLSEGG